MEGCKCQPDGGAQQGRLGGGGAIAIFLPFAHDVIDSVAVLSMRSLEATSKADI